MCIRIWRAVAPGGTIETARQLGELVGGLDNLVYHESDWNTPIPEFYWHEWAQNSCLCPVDIRATLNDAGILWEDDTLGDINLVAPETTP